IETGDGVPYNGQETDSGKLWRSDDGGENWKLVSYDRRMGGRTHYYFRVEVSPDNVNEVQFLKNTYGRSTEGGQTLVGGGGGGGGGGFGGPIPRSTWIGIAGGESGWATPDPVDNNIIWSSASGSGSVGGIVEVFNLKTGQARNVEVWPENVSGEIAANLKYRFVWTMPLTISPHDHNKVYVGSQFVHQTTDGGNSWQVISPDL